MDGAIVAIVAERTNKAKHGTTSRRGFWMVDNMSSSFVISPSIVLRVWLRLARARCLQPMP